MYQPLATANGDYSSYVDNSSNGGIGTDVKFNVFGALQQAAANFAAANFDFSYPATSSSSNSCSAIGVGGNGSISHFTPPTMMMAPMVSAASCSSSALSSSSASASALHLNSAVGPVKRERTKYSEYQLAYLNAIFRETKYPDGARREEIAQQLQLTDVKVQVWFKNRRAKVRNEVNIEKKLEAAKIVASRRTGAGGPTKREASVEDTEEEDQQQQQRGKSEANGNKKTRHSAVKTEHKSNNFSNSSPPPPPLPTFPLPAPTADDGTSFLASAYQQQLPKAADVGTFGQCWPTTAASATSASLMQMAAAFPSAGHNFYSGWPQAAYTPPSFLSSAYPASQMFGQLAGSAASYYPSAAGTAGGQCGYYFPAQQAVQQQQQQPD